MMEENRPSAAAVEQEPADARARQGGEETNDAQNSFSP
jgi:hypothetical protein